MVTIKQAPAMDLSDRLFMADLLMARMVECRRQLETGDSDYWAERFEEAEILYNKLMKD